MKKQFGGWLCAFLILSVTIISWKPAATKPKGKIFNKPFAAHELLEKYVDNIYETAHLEETGLEFNVFKKALTGFINLKKEDKLSPNSTVFTVIDYTQPSSKKRMWIVDVLNKMLVLNTWVAHGQGSGDEVASRFSDKMDSHKSSVGFYLTDDVYYGEHGRSLRLDGLDIGFNANARKRAIVLHAADYVGETAMALQGHAGRSFGCPAVAPEVADQVIDAIKDRTMIFAYGKDKHYSSKYLDENSAATFLIADPNSNFIASL
jgi:hypothetical protein